MTTLNRREQGTGDAAIREAGTGEGAAIIVTYKSKVWTPTLRSRSKWRVLGWRQGVAGIKWVSLQNVSTGKRVGITADVLRLSFAAKRQMAAIFTPEMERRAV